MIRKLGLAVGLASGAASAVYLFVYLARWEWNRALISGMLLVIVEVLVVGGVVLSRLGRLERAVEARPEGGARAGIALDHLRRTRPPASRPFAWLDPARARGTNVFVPVLLGAGVVVSGLAWLVERVARAVARPGMEQDLARSLDAIAYPSALVAVDDHLPSAVALLDGPVARPLGLGAVAAR